MGFSLAGPECEPSLSQLLSSRAVFVTPVSPTLHCVEYLNIAILVASLFMHVCIHPLLFVLFMTVFHLNLLQMPHQPLISLPQAEGMDLGWCGLAVLLSLALWAWNLSGWLFRQMPVASPPILCLGPPAG